MCTDTEKFRSPTKNLSSNRMTRNNNNTEALYSCPKTPFDVSCSLNDNLKENHTVNITDSSNCKTIRHLEEVDLQTIPSYIT